MDIVSALTIIVALAFAGVTIYVANQEEAEGKPPRLSRFFLFGMVAGMFSLIPSTYGVMTAPDYGGQPADFPLVMGLILVATVFGYFATASLRLRQFIARVIGHTFNPQSSVHTTALVMSMLLVVLLTVTFILGGGIEGYAQSMEENGVSIGEAIFLAVLQISAAFLGVGLAIRRTLGQSLERLGLRRPTRADITTGIIGGGALYGMALAFAGVWITLLPEQFAEQTSAADQIGRSFTTLPLAFLLALSAGFGEEILVRGALQPVFGIFVTSVFFALLHTQHLVTPGLLLIFLVSLGFGWLRKRYSTNAAIIAHFVYNFVPLALAALARL